MKRKSLLIPVVLLTILFAGGCLFKLPVDPTPDPEPEPEEPLVLTWTPDGDLTTEGDWKVLTGNGIVLREDGGATWDIKQHDGGTVLYTTRPPNEHGDRHLNFEITSEDALDLSLGTPVTVEIKFYRGPFGEFNFRYDAHDNNFKTVTMGGSDSKELYTWEIPLDDAEFAHGQNDWGDFDMFLWIGGDGTSTANDNFLLKSITITIDKE